jgi:glycine cleavage system H lipoate-binding protein
MEGGAGLPKGDSQQSPKIVGGIMSILFVLLTFLLLISITYFRRHGVETAVQVQSPAPRPPGPQLARQLGFEIPKGYAFHPGHTWVLDEGRQNARIGLDSFAANLLGNIERIEIGALNRWVRQGQKLMTLTREGMSIELLSPIEGVITAVNHEAIKDPSLVLKDPYRNGWICIVKSPEMATNVKNLVQGPLVGAWLQNSVSRVTAMAQQMMPAMAQDGGLPVNGIMSHLDPDSQRKLIQEFFLS